MRFVRTVRARLAVPVLAVLLLATSAGVPALAEVSPGRYTAKPPAHDGIGKVYMGREISFVMGHRGADWLERPAREGEERPDLVVAGMDLAPDAVVADVGAGSGYFTFRVAQAVPDGRVLAVDIQEEMLRKIRRRARKADVGNVETVLGDERDPRLPAGAVDAVLLVDAYHEFAYPFEMMSAIVEALAPGGRVFLVEYRGEDPDVPILPLHKMTEAQARREMEAVGLTFVENRPILPTQHFLIFERR